MSIQTQINRIKGAKTAFKEKLEGLGVTVPSTAKIDEYPPLLDNIETGVSGPAFVTETRWRVIFCDYDGTLISETMYEPGAMIEFPSDPTPPPGYVFNGWNQTIDHVPSSNNTHSVTTEYYTNEYDYNRTIVIGPEYEYKYPASNNTTTTVGTSSFLYVDINTQVNATVGFYVQPSSADGITVNWGDGTTSSCTATANTKLTHTYSTYADNGQPVRAVCIKISPNNSTVTYKFGQGSSGSNTGTTGMSGGLREAAIGTGCTMIGNYAFYNCQGLRKVRISNSVTTIGTYAFCACFNLGRLIYPTAVTTIGQYATHQCNSLQCIVVPHSVTNMGSLGRLYSVKYISVGRTSSTTGGTIRSNGTLQDCFSLKGISSMYMLASVINVNQSVLYSVDKLENAIATTKMPRSASLSEVLETSSTTFSSLASPFIGCHNLKRVNCKNKTSLPVYAFMDCDSLEELTNVDSLTTLSAGAFQRCVSLRTVPELTNATTINTAFYGCCALNKLSLPALSANMPGSAFYGCYALNEVILPSSGITAFASTHIFNGCASLQMLKAPDTISSSAGYALYNMTCMSFVHFPDSLDYIQGYTFANDTALSIIDFGNTRTTIPAFGTSAGSTIAGTTTYINVTSLLYIVVPDALYDEWYAKSAWAAFKKYLIKYSDFNSLQNSGTYIGNFNNGSLASTVDKRCNMSTYLASITYGGHIIDCSNGVYANEGE